MVPRLVNTVIAIGTICIFLAASHSASAQGTQMRRLGLYSSVQLAQLEEVQAELNLTDEQKHKVRQLNEELNTARRDVFRNASGDFQQMREGFAKLNAEFTEKFNAALEEPQQRRVQEVYVQVNGPRVLTDASIAKELKLTDEQQAKLQQAVQDSLAAGREAFQNFQSLSDEERAKKAEELVESRNKSYLAVLTEEQKEQFEKMKGKKLEVDLSNLPSSRRP